MTDEFDPDELRDLRLLDSPTVVPRAFSDRLRAELLSSFDDLSGDARLIALRTEPEAHPARGRVSWLAAAAAVVAVIGAAIGLLATNPDPAERPVASDRASACASFVDRLPDLVGTGDEGTVTPPRIAELRDAFTALEADLARLGDVSAADLSVLGRVVGALREAQLDLEAGDEAGSATAVTFALERLQELETIELVVAPEGTVCR